MAVTAGHAQPQPPQSPTSPSRCLQLSVGVPDIDSGSFGLPRKSRDAIPGRQVHQILTIVPKNLRTGLPSAMGGDASPNSTHGIDLRNLPRRGSGVVPISSPFQRLMAESSPTDHSPTHSPPVEAVTGPPRSSRLTPLTGLRFLAALHIFVFHIAAMPSPEEMRQMTTANAPPSVEAAEGPTANPQGTRSSLATATAETDRAAENSPASGVLNSAESPRTDGTATNLSSDSPPRGTGPGGQPAGPPATGEGGGDRGPERGLYRALPSPLAWLIKRGFVSTGLFFLLSGLVLAYLYVDGSGCQTVSTREFLLGRWVRLYPLHLAVLPIVFPLLLGMLSFFPETTLWGWPVSKPQFVGLTGLMSLLLVQAWCPEAALTWNFATWALSTVAFFYVMFPLVVRLLRGWSRPALWRLFWLLPVLNLVPTFVFLSLTDGNSTSNYFWSEFVMRTPLFWLPHFVMAIVMCRLCHISRHDPVWQSRPPTSGRPGWGDLAAALLLLVMMTPDSVYQALFGLGTKPPNFVLRHGLLAPLICFLLHELAAGRGWLARVLSHPWLETLGEASFGIFILQGPVLFPVLFLFGPLLEMLRPTCERWLGSPEQAHNLLEIVRVSLTVLLVVGLALLSVRWFEKPVARRLRQRLALPSAAS